MGSICLQCHSNVSKVVILLFDSCRQPGEVKRRGADEIVTFRAQIQEMALEKGPPQTILQASIAVWRTFAQHHFPYFHRALCIRTGCLHPPSPKTTSAATYYPRSNTQLREVAFSPYFVFSAIAGSRSIKHPVWAWWRIPAGITNGYSSSALFSPSPKSPISAYNVSDFSSSLIYSEGQIP